MNDLIGKMMYVNYDFSNSKLLKVFNIALQKSFPIYRRKRFRMFICPGFKPCSQSGGKNHCFPEYSFKILFFR